MLFGSLPLILAALLLWQGPPVWSGAFVAAIAYNVVLANAMGWFLWFFVLHSLLAGIAGISSLLTPVVGLAAAWMQLGERPDASEALGAAAVISALLMIILQDVFGRFARTSTTPE
jgi:drug/metabolite transporter (DMT)-like permease